MKKKIIGILIVLLCLPISSCKNSKNDSNITVIESEDSYKTISVNIDNKNYRYPSFVEDIERNEKEFHFIFDYTELEEIFEYSTKKEVEDYFDKDLFDDNFVLTIARKESIPEEYYYSGLSINEINVIELNIDSNKKVSNETQKLDFIIIEKNVVEDYDSKINYQWMINDLFVGLSQEDNDKILSKYVADYQKYYYENHGINDIYISRFYGVYNGAYAISFEGKYLVYANMGDNDISILNYTFKINSISYFIIYSNDKFYSLEEAYNQNILRDIDIEKLYYNHIFANLNTYLNNDMN